MSTSSLSSNAVASFAFGLEDLSESLAASCSTSGMDRREGVSIEDMESESCTELGMAIRRGGDQSEDDDDVYGSQKRAVKTRVRMGRLRVEERVDSRRSRRHGYAHRNASTGRNKYRPRIATTPERRNRREGEKEKDSASTQRG